MGTASMAVIPPNEPAFEMKVKDSGKLGLLAEGGEQIWHEGLQDTPFPAACACVPSCMCACTRVQQEKICQQQQSLLLVCTQSLPTLSPSS